MPLKDRVTPEAAVAEGLAYKCRQLLNNSDTAFDAHTAIAPMLGGQVDGDVATFGFWTPELLDNRVPDGDVFLEVLSPKGPLDLTRAHQQVTFERIYLPVSRYDAHTFAAAKGMLAGSREQGGDFYWRGGATRPTGKA